MSKNDLVEAGRTTELPPAVADRGYDTATWNTLRSVLFRGASDAAMLMVLDYCKARKLDPLKRPVHIVKVWDRDANNGKGALVETVWQGINELRTTAQRTGQFAGMDEPKIGPAIEKQVGTTTVQFPEWAQVTVYRMIQGTRVPYAGPRVYWTETYAQASARDTTPNRMWMRRPVGQLVKCAEAAALRAAFPEELGHEYAAEEMEGQIVNDEPRHMLQEPGLEPMTIEGEMDDLPDEAGADAPQSPPEPRQAPKSAAKAPTATNGTKAADEAPTGDKHATYKQGALGGAPFGKPEMYNNPPDELSNSIPIGDDGGEVAYVDGRGGKHPMDLAAGVGRLEQAAEARDSLNDEAFAAVMWRNEWCQDRAPAAWRALWASRRMVAADWRPA